MKKILVVGNFDILHPGHIRLLKFAKECGDHLTVAINADSIMQFPSQVKEDYRLEIVKSLESVDHAFVTTLSPQELVEKLTPWAVVKGKEFETIYNPEQETLASYGGKLFFGSGEFSFDSKPPPVKDKKMWEHFDYSELHDYAQRHSINYTQLLSLFNNIQKLKVGVIGEVIVDEYVQGKAVGLSQEDPTIVMTPNKTDIFLGGAAITAGHIRSIGAQEVTLFSVIGKDEKANYTRDSISEYQIDALLLEDESRPTPLKTRYRVDKKTLLRVNQLRQHKISIELQDKLFNAIQEKIKQLDILVFSDFNYGLLPQKLVERIISICQESNVQIVSDSQTSSQVGDVSRYKDVHLMTPTENEVRVALNNFDDGLVILAKKLCEKSNPKNLVITLADEGIFIHIPDIKGNSWRNDKIPALNKNAVDPAGAGDCFLAASSLFMAAGATPWQAFYVASLAAACQVNNLGNTPLHSHSLIKTIKQSFKSK